VQQVIEGDIGDPAHVVGAAVDQLAERGQRDVEPPRRVVQRHQHLVAVVGPPGDECGQAGPGLFQGS